MAHEEFAEGFFFLELSMAVGQLAWGVEFVQYGSKEESSLQWRLLSSLPPSRGLGPHSNPRLHSRDCPHIGDMCGPVKPGPAPREWVTSTGECNCCGQLHTCVKEGFRCLRQGESSVQEILYGLVSM